MGLIGGFCHFYIGQEAVVVGMEVATKEGDKCITSYRDHGHMLACGMEARGVMAELTGRIGGYSKGKGGSMHMFSREKHFYGGHGIVAAQVPLGAGLAFANTLTLAGGTLTAADNLTVNGAFNWSGGTLAGNIKMSAGLSNFGEVAMRIIKGEANRGVAHATSGPCLQQNLVAVLEGK